MSDEITQIKDKIDVADLISEYVQLKPAGVNKKGLCPFHHERTPSFMVNSERQGWHCFGCNKGGDIFTFVQEMEGMEFKDALKYLADKAGVQLTQYRNEIDSSQRNRIKEINKETARFFHNFLLKIPSAKPALDYLLNRGLKMETIENWQIGFIPEQWDLLTQYLLKKGFGIDDLVAAGITIKREGADAKSGKGFYDRFRGRIMFPIWNAHDEVVGFTGRILVEKENTGGKYVNTPQTLVYDKSRVIFGLNKAKQEIKAKDLIVMVEGQMDVIACHQAGMKNVVASSGTALTEEQVKLLKRYSGNINMAFDADEAGQNASKKGIEIAVREGMNVKVIRIPEGRGKDPDECLNKNPEIWFVAVRDAQEVMQWYFEKIFAGKDLSDHKQKQQTANQLLPEIALIPYAVERDHWLRRLAERLGVEAGVLREDLAQIKDQKTKNKNDIDEQQVTGNELQFASQRGRFELLLEKLLSLFLKFPYLASEENGGLDKILVGTVYFALYVGIKNGYNVEVLRKEAQGDKIKENLVDVLLLQGEWEFSSMSEMEVKKEMENIIRIIKEEWIRKRRREIQLEIEKAEKAGDVMKLKLLLGEFKNL